MSDDTLVADEIYFWIGYPPNPDAGFSECGIRTSSETDKLVSEIEAHFGHITAMFATVPGLPGVVGMTTALGYRVAVIERRHVDVASRQESIAEWVEGIW